LWQPDAGAVSYPMKNPFLSLTMIITLSACASSPIEIISRDSRGQQQERYFTSSDFCGQQLVAEKGFAVFAVEKGTALGGNRLIVWLYNLTDIEIRVRVHTFNYHGTRISVRKTMMVTASERIMILDQSVAYEVYGSDSTLSYDLSVAGQRELGLIELQHRRYRSQSQARHACEPPDSIADS
jgi:hypothetical protein